MEVSQKPPEKDVKANNRKWLAGIQGSKPAARWTIAVVLGGVAISWFGRSGFETDSDIRLRLILPVVIIAAYAWLGYRDTHSLRSYPALRQARIGQLADSVYYLGFLWTLWALIDSFVVHDLSAAEAAFRAFGYALITTASGMFLRLALLQFSYSAEDQGPLSEQLIEEEIVRFSSSIRMAVDELKGFQGRIKKVATAFEAATDNLKAQSSALEISVESFSGSVDKLPDRVADELHAKVQPQLKAVGDSVVRVEESMVSSLKRVEIRTQQVDKGLAEYATVIGESLKVSAGRIEAATRSLTESLPAQMDMLVRSLSKVTEQISDIRVSPDVIEKSLVKSFEARTHQVDEGFAEHATAIGEKLKESTGQIEAATRSLTELLPAQMELLVVSLTKVSEQIGEIRVSPDVIEKSLVTSFEARTQQVDKGFAEHASAIGEKLKESAGHIEAATRSLTESLPAQMELLVRSLSKVTDQISEIRVFPDIIETTIQRSTMGTGEDLVRSARVLQEAMDDLSKSLQTATKTLDRSDGEQHKRFRWW